MVAVTADVPENFNCLPGDLDWRWGRLSQPSALPKRGDFGIESVAGFP
jgi:hypothetical protein